MTQAGSLPTPTSDAAVAALAGTAYVVGGYDGAQALDTIIAWRPGGRPRIVARLPYGLRYAAVAASDGRLVIAGGSHGEAATAAILSFDPATRELRRSASCPTRSRTRRPSRSGPTSTFVGGRGSAPGTQTAAIVAVDPASGSSLRVGRLPQPLSDAAAVVLGRRVWVAGGLSASGPVDLGAGTHAHRPLRARQGARSVAANRSSTSTGARGPRHRGCSRTPLPHPPHGCDRTARRSCGPRIDHDHAVVAVIVGEDVPIRQRQRQRGRSSAAVPVG